MTDRDELTEIQALVDARDERAAFARVRARLAWPRGKDLTDITAWLEKLCRRSWMRGAV